MVGLVMLRVVLIIATKEKNARVECEKSISYLNAF